VRYVITIDFKNTKKAGVSTSSSSRF